MRILMVIATAVLVTGCSAPGPTEHAEPAPASEAAPVPIVLAEGSYEWHETGGGPAGALDYSDAAFQAVSSSCTYEGRPFFTNLKLGIGRAGQLPPMAGELSVAVDWTDQDWLGARLFSAYQAPGMADFDVSPPIGRGETIVVPIRVQGTEGDATEWSVWLCINEDEDSMANSPDHQPGPFLGSVQAKVVFTPTAGTVATQAAA